MDKKTIRKHEIINKSIHVMLANGYNGTGVKDLTDAAGIPKGSLYNYFINKEDYAKEAMYLYYNVMSQKQFSHLINENLAPLERIKLFYSTMIKDFKDESNWKRGCFIGNLTQEMGGVSDLLCQVTNDIHCEIVQKIQKCLSDAVKNEDIQKNTNSDELASFIASSWQGSLLRIKVSNSRDILDDFYSVLTKILLK